MSDFVVGLTGGIGSGKSAASDYFATKGITVVDADVVARDIVQAGTAALAAIAQRYGKDILLDDGALNRAELRSIVFADARERQWLEGLTHPLINRQIEQQLQNAISDYAILSSPLLLQNAQQTHCDKIIVMDVPETTQLERAMARDDNDEAQVKRIMAAQMGREQRLEKADFILDNTTSPAALYQQIDKLHPQLLALSSTN
ncbi:MAG: dephospho-CoA kinase [Gammaproteobacteria bacterium]|nr:MAG: dephospho-CoA kinase [Gammaproteobacteria bacterium]PIE38258.1 MAG: dephospho-CoA kinase [Gammaproteobacteria bacterium]